MTQKLDLIGALRRTAEGATPRPPAAASGTPAPRPVRTNVTGYFPQAVKRQLRNLAADHDTTIQRLLAEALNDLFVKYGKPEVAPVD